MQFNSVNKGLGEMIKQTPRNQEKTITKT